ncbi:MAG: hypothetical protein ABI905_17070 [Betaproteobacteria bacterium]
MRLRGRLAALVIAALVTGSCATRPPDPATFSFALMGDQQYNPYEEAVFPQMLDAISAEPLAFVVHVGDFKAGSFSPCTDKLYLRRREEFNQSKHAFILTPGDNDWIDCRRNNNGHADPFERLAKIREIFFADNRSLGKEPITVLRQSEVHAADPVLARYRENALWKYGGLVFATFNIQGGNDNFGHDAVSDAEHAERTRANIAWLKFAAAEASHEGMLGLAIFLQANPGFEEPVAKVNSSGFAEFLRAFEREAKALRKPVLFAHGDTHQYRVQHPYLNPLDRQPIANVTRVETHGSPFTNWVRITVIPRDAANPFTIKPGGFSPAVKSD